MEKEGQQEVVKQPILDQAQAKAQLLGTPIKNENDALNVIVSFLNIAQRRGCFSMDESAKIFECIKCFQKP